MVLKKVNNDDLKILKTQNAFKIEHKIIFMFQLKIKKEKGKKKNINE